MGHPKKTAYRLKRIRIQGFRRLKDLDLPIRPLVVLIGPNSVGKTSLLDAFSLLGASAAGKLNATISEMGGLSSVVTRGETSELSFSLDLEVPSDEPLRYEIRLAVRGPGYAIVEERLTQEHEGDDVPFKHIDSREGDIRYFETEERKLVRPNWEHDPLETSLAQVPKLYRQPEELRTMLAGMARRHLLDVGPNAPIRLPQRLRPAPHPGVHGEELVPYLYHLRESAPERYETIEDTLRSAFPRFEKLSFPAVAVGMLTMTWKERGHSAPFELSELSDGFLRFLWHVALLAAPSLPPVLLLDEPEVSLHPAMLALLADFLREASRRSLIIVATQSERLVGFLKPEEIVVLDLDEEGHAGARWADQLNIAEWLAEYSLGELWTMGVLGGRP